MNRRRASILPSVLVVLSILIILLGSLHYYEGQNIQGVQRAEAVLHARVALRWWEAKWLGRASETPALRVSVSAKENEELKQAAEALEKPWGSAIFDRSKLPDFLNKPALGLRQGQRQVRVELRDGLPYQRLGAMKMTGSTSFPYAAYAPGNVQIGRLKSWANPAFSDGQAKEAQGGGVCARVYAGSQASIGQIDYGVIEMGNNAPSVKSGQFVAFPRLGVPSGPDGKPLQEVVGLQLKDAMEKLSERNRQDGDRTACLFNQLDVGALLNYTVGGGDWETYRKSFMSLATATEFPFFTWATVRIGIEVWPPKLKALSFRLMGTRIPDCALIDDLKGAAAPPDSPKDQRAKLAILQERKESGLAIVQTALQKDSQKISHDIEQALRKAGPSQKNLGRWSEIEKRSDEVRYKVDWAGQPGIVYPGWIEELPKLVHVAGLILQIPPKILEACKAYTRTLPVYWFGQERPEGGLQFFPHVKIAQGAQPRLELRSTMTVPRGRSFYMKGDLNLEGDLWIQRGASFQVDGSLTLIHPNDPQDYPFFGAQGRIILEQGATLVVRDNLNVPGSRRWGSVMVTSEEGRVEGITSAILVGGNASFDYGVVPGTTVEDLCIAVGRKDPQVARFQKEYLDRYFELFAPNLAKCRGPFQVRKPIFADTSTELAFDPLPTVMPPIRWLNSPNLNCLFFQVATLSEVPFLNAVFGEFMALHSDAWAFGDEIVPVLVKVPSQELESMAGRWGSLYSDASLPPDADARMGGILAEVHRVVHDTPKVLMTDVYWELFRQCAWILLPIDPPISDDVYGHLAKAREKAWLLCNQAGPFEVSHIRRGLYQHFKDNYNVPFSNAEFPGALVYAGGNLVVGAKGDTPAPAVGMFVAGGNIRSNSQRMVGSAMSLHGHVMCRELWYYPGFTRASITLPGPMPVGQRDPIEQIGATKYGSRLNPKPDALLIGVGRPQITSEAIER